MRKEMEELKRALSAIKNQVNPQSVTGSPASSRKRLPYSRKDNESSDSTDVESIDSQESVSQLEPPAEEDTGIVPETPDKVQEGVRSDSNEHANTAGGEPATLADLDKVKVKGWNTVIGAVQSFLGDKVESKSGTPKKQFRTKSPADALLAAAEPARLPLDPRLSATLEAFQKEIEKPVKRSEQKKGPMGVNRLFDPEREVQDRFFKPIGQGGFLHPQEVPTDFGLLDKSQTKPKVGSCTLTEEQLSLAEKRDREILAVRSVRNWISDTMEAVIKDMASAENKSSHISALESLVEHDKELRVIEEDRLTVNLVNNVLRRRDLYLGAIKPRLEQDTLILLRKSSFLGESLFDNLTKEVLEKEKGRRNQVMMMEAVNKPVVVSPSAGPAKTGLGGTRKKRGKRAFKQSAGSFTSKGKRTKFSKKGNKGAGPAGASKSTKQSFTKTSDKGGSGQQ